MQNARFVLLIGLMVICGCASKSIGPQTRLALTENDLALIDGNAMFGETITAAPSVELITRTPAMTAFITEDMRQSDFSLTRVRLLMEKLVAHGYFDDQYEATLTSTAADTFAARRGNCLSYTNLFVALAREAGLDASYQVVDMPPTWDVESGVLLRNKHINVMLDNITVPGVASKSLTIDFNIAQPRPDVKTWVVTDAYAESLYHANLAVDRMRDGDDRGSFSELKRAILTDPGNQDAWNNLGAVYSMRGYTDAAEQVYRKVLSINPQNETAVYGLAKALRKLKLEEAEHYTKIARRYQARNPFYHFALAQHAYSDEAYDRALNHVNKAIALDRNNAQFHNFRAKVANNLGDEVLAAKSRKRAEKYARIASRDSRTLRSSTRARWSLLVGS